MNLHYVSSIHTFLNKKNMIIQMKQYLENN